MLHADALPVYGVVKQTPAAVPMPSRLRATILLPVAYHDHQDASLVQLVGPPQTVIPVAIARGAGPSPLCRPSASASASASAGSPPKSLPLGVRAAVAVRPLARRVSDDEPLDLSMNSRASSAASSSVDSRHSSVSEKPCAPTGGCSTSAEGSGARKRLLCECGVSFLSLDNLASHRRYYCRQRDEQAAQEDAEQRATPGPGCKRSHETPLAHGQHASASSHHVFVCLLCGYKGYSQRGIRSHLRVAHAAAAALTGKEGRHFAQLVIPVAVGD